MSSKKPFDTIDEIILKILNFKALFSAVFVLAGTRKVKEDIYAIGTELSSFANQFDNQDCLVILSNFSKGLRVLTREHNSDERKKASDVPVVVSAYELNKVFEQYPAYMEIYAGAQKIAIQRFSSIIPNILVSKIVDFHRYPNDRMEILQEIISALRKDVKGSFDSILDLNDRTKKILDLENLIADINKLIEKWISVYAKNSLNTQTNDSDEVLDSLLKVLLYPSDHESLPSIDNFLFVLQALLRDPQMGHSQMKIFLQVYPQLTNYLKNTLDELSPVAARFEDYRGNKLYKEITKMNEVLQFQENQLNEIFREMQQSSDEGELKKLQKKYKTLSETLSLTQDKVLKLIEKWIDVNGYWNEQDRRQIQTLKAFEKTSAYSPDIHESSEDYIQKRFLGIKLRIMTDQIEAARDILKNAYAQYKKAKKSGSMEALNSLEDLVETIKDLLEGQFHFIASSGFWTKELEMLYRTFIENDQKFASKKWQPDASYLKELEKYLKRVDEFYQYSRTQVIERVIKKDLSRGQNIDSKNLDRMFEESRLLFNSRECRGSVEAPMVESCSVGLHFSFKPLPMKTDALRAKQHRFVDQKDNKCINISNSSTTHIA